MENEPTLIWTGSALAPMAVAAVFHDGVPKFVEVRWWSPS